MYVHVRVHVVRVHVIHVYLVCVHVVHVHVVRVHVVRVRVVHVHVVHVCVLFLYSRRAAEYGNLRGHRESYTNSLYQKFTITSYTFTVEHQLGHTSCSLPYNL